MMDSVDESRSDLLVDEETLPGLGPIVELDELEVRITADIRHHPDASRPSAIVEMMMAQKKRWEWFADKVAPIPPVETLASALMNPAPGPGEREQALVALSLSNESMAPVVLQAWQVPEDDMQLALLHQICLAKSFFGD